MPYGTTVLHTKLTRLCHVRSPTRRLYFEEAVARARQREADEADRRRRAKDKLVSYMKHSRPAVREDSVWEDWLAEHEREPEVKAVGRGVGRGRSNGKGRCFAVAAGGGVWTGGALAVRTGVGLEGIADREYGCCSAWWAGCHGRGCWAGCRASQDACARHACFCMIQQQDTACYFGPRRSPYQEHRRVNTRCEVHRPGTYCATSHRPGTYWYLLHHVLQVALDEARALFDELVAKLKKRAEERGAERDRDSEDGSRERGRDRDKDRDRDRRRRGGSRSDDDDGGRGSKKSRKEKKSSKRWAGGLQGGMCAQRAFCSFEASVSWDAVKYRRPGPVVQQ